MGLVALMAAGALALLAGVLREVAPRAWTIALLALAGSPMVLGLVAARDAVDGAALVAASVAVAAWWPRRQAAPRLVAAASGLAALAAWQSGPREPWLSALWGAGDGLFFWMPVAWAGAAGLVALARKEPWTAASLLAAAAAAAGLAAAAVAGGAARVPGPRFAAVLPFLGVTIAAGLETLRAAVARRPLTAVAVLGGAFVLWNGLLMQQYRDLAIPRDDTIVFARAFENGAALLTRRVGAPPAWPGAWLAARQGLPVARAEALLPRTVREGGTLAAPLGAPETEDALLGRGWSVRHPCGTDACRAIEGTAEVLVPLARRTGLLVTIDAGPGELTVRWNGVHACALSLPARRTCAVPLGSTRGGLNVLALEAEGLLVRALTVSAPSGERE